MNIAFDIHGTLDLYEKMRSFLWILEKFQHSTSNIKIFIISGAPEEEIRKELDELELPQKVHIISVVDYLKAVDIAPMWQEKDGTWWTLPDVWWKSKGDICRDYKIDILIDNEEKYIENMPKSTIFLKVI